MRALDDNMAEARQTPVGEQSAAQNPKVFPRGDSYYFSNYIINPIPKLSKNEVKGTGVFFFRAAETFFETGKAGPFFFGDSPKIINQTAAVFCLLDCFPVKQVRGHRFFVFPRRSAVEINGFSPPPDNSIPSGGGVAKQKQKRGGRGF